MSLGIAAKPKNLYTLHALYTLHTLYAPEPPEPPEPPENHTAPNKWQPATLTGGRLRANMLGLE